MWSKEEMQKFIVERRNVLSNLPDKFCVPAELNSELKLCDMLSQLLREAEENPYRELLILFADPTIDNLDDVELDIKDWVEAIDKVISGETTELCGACVDGAETFWHCKICDILNSKEQSQ
jgi:hypothetical protein